MEFFGDFSSVVSLNLTDKMFDIDLLTYKYYSLLFFLCRDMTPERPCVAESIMFMRHTYVFFCQFSPRVLDISKCRAEFSVFLNKVPLQPVDLWKEFEFFADWSHRLLCEKEDLYRLLDLDVLKVEYLRLRHRLFKGDVQKQTYNGLVRNLSFVLKHKIDTFLSPFP